MRANDDGKCYQTLTSKFHSNLALFETRRTKSKQIVWKFQRSLPGQEKRELSEEEEKNNKKKLFEAIFSEIFSGCKKLANSLFTRWIWSLNRSRRICPSLKILAGFRQITAKPTTLLTSWKKVKFFHEIKRNSI